MGFELFDDAVDPGDLDEAGDRWGDDVELVRLLLDASSDGVQAIPPMASSTWRWFSAAVLSGPPSGDRRPMPSRSGAPSL